MKHLFLTSVISLFLVNTAIAQVVPKTPKTTSKSSSTTKSSSSYSVTFNTDEHEENSSISIKRSDDIYKFTAKFHESKLSSIRKLVIDKLGKTDLKITNNTYKWTKNENDKKLYDCSLTDNTLKIYVDKEYSNSKTIDMMEDLGAALKDAITGNDSKEEAKNDAKRDLKNAERELEKAKRKVENAKRRVEKNN